MEPIDQSDKNQYKGQNLSNPLFFDGEKVVSPGRTQIMVDFYALTEAKFHILDENRTSWLNISSNIFFLSIGFLLPLLGKFLVEEDIKRWEWVTLAIAVIITVGCYIKHTRTENPQTRLKKEIRKELKIDQ